MKKRIETGQGRGDAAKMMGFVKRIPQLLLLATALVLSGCASQTRQPLAQPPAFGLFPSPAAPVIPNPSGDGGTALPPPASSVQAPDASAAKAQNPPKSDPVNNLLDRVDKLYDAGTKDYSAEKFDQAKSEFDQAVALILESGMDIQADDRLSSEFNRLVENVYTMELGAVQNGNTLSSHRYEPAPIQAFAGLTFPVDPNVRERAQQEVAAVQSDLPLVSNDFVSGALTYLQSHARHYVQTVLDRRALYGPMIEDTLRNAGLPQDLIYLAAGESAFNPFAVSNKGAKGIWQFMPETAALYGLRHNRWVDEREDPVKSTRAAARHLNDLYHTFGDWFLAMAAYDWNPAGVQKAIQKTGYADYWKLRELHALPSETENYVPIFVAVALIAKDPKAYGFEPTASEVSLDHVEVSEPTDLRLVAGLIDHPIDELVRINPGLLSWVTPPGEAGYTLNLPAGTKDQFEKAIAQIPPAKREWWRAYRFEASDTLPSVAARFHVPLAGLRAANHLASDDPPGPDTHLLVPLGPSTESSLLRVHERSVLRARVYHVKPGDTLELVADRFDVTPYQIRHWNHLQSSALTAGHSLTVFVPTPVRSSGHPHSRKSTIKRRKKTSTTTASR